MTDKRLNIYRPAAALDRLEGRAVRSERPAREQAEFSPGGPPYRLLQCRITGGGPVDPPDERYYADEVRPKNPDAGGHMEWEPAPGGLVGAVVYNVAEAGAGTHLLAADTVIRVEERLDRREPPEMVYLAYVPMPPDRLARIVSYDNGMYTVQPVRKESSGFVDEGSPIEGVVNLGELWEEEAGYLAGPTAFDRYVLIRATPAGWVIVLHPPRMV